MIAPSARTGAVAAAALALTGTAIAQQLAANQDPWADAPQYVERICGTGNEAKYKTNAGLDLYVDCVKQAQIAHAREVRAAAEKVTADAEKRAAAARKEAAEHRQARAEAEKQILEHQKAGEASRIRAQCLSDITKALTSTPPRITRADVNAAKTTPTASDDPCVWRGRLQPQLGELSKR
jgi:hypothetical protein